MNQSNHSTCRICQAPFSASFVLKEMNFAMGDAFTYHQCAECKCIQIDTFPADIARYYPTDYYSFNLEVPLLQRQSLFNRLMKDQRMKKVYRKKDIYDLRPLKAIPAYPSQRILDVGCGKGAFICELFNLGFEKVEGLDKFIAADIDYGFGVKIWKKELDQMPAAEYDIIMMHHVLEHVENQQQELRHCYRLLKKEGCLLIRIPLIGKAWERYGVNWFQLDAPRHFFIHSLKSMQLLAAQTGFEIRKTIFDSTAFQFMVSELYERGISLHTPGASSASYTSYFTTNEIKDFEKKAEEWNALQQGDQAAFYLYKK